MEVKIKLLKNGQAIKDAEKINSDNKKARELYNANPNTVIKEEWQDIVVPDQDVEEVPYNFNVFDVDWFTTSINGMTYVSMENGKAFECIKNPEVEKEMAKAISLKEDFKRKSLELK